MKIKSIIASLLLIASTSFGATRYETDDIVFGGNTYFTNSVTSSNNITMTAQPANGDHLATVDYVCSLFSGGEYLYASTNIHPVNTNFYGFVMDLPNYGFERTYTAVTNNQYIGSQMSTQRFFYVYSPVSVNAYLGYNTGGGRQVSVKAEIYYTYDGTNLLGDWDSQAQALGATNLLKQWVVSFPTITATNSTGVYIVRKFKVTSQANSPNITFTGGTNSPSHIAFSSPPSTDLGVRGATNLTGSGISSTYDTSSRVLGVTFNPNYYTNTGTINLTAATTNNTGITMNGNNWVLDKPVFYSTNIPFSATATLSLYNSANLYGCNEQWRSSVLFSSVYNTNALLLGTNLIVVSDGTAFSTLTAPFQVIIVDSTSNECVTVTNLTGNSLYIDRPTKYSHAWSNAISHGVSLNVAGFVTDIDGTTTLRTFIQFSAAQTVGINYSIPYTKVK